MQVGIALPHFGPAASPKAILDVARQAEALRFDSVWALDRLLWPLRATSKYPGNPKGNLPGVMQSTYDPLTVLTYVAAHTKRVRLGTSVLVAAYRSPVVVAKMVATLDLLSEGRLILGVGSGWSKDEFVAVNQPWTEKDERTDEFLKVLFALWTAGEASFEGQFYRVPESFFLPKPLQRPHPPIWIGGNSRRAIRRAAEFGDGWHPTSRFSPSALAEEMKHLQDLAEKAGRDPSAIALTLRWNAFPSLTEKHVLGEVAERLHQYREVGVQHVCFDLNIPEPSSLTVMLETMHLLIEEIIPRA